MQKILIATHNFGKYKELMEVLEELPFKFVSLNDEKIEEDVEEHGDSFEANAILKAEFFSRLTGLPAIADDSGIHVDALHAHYGLAESESDFRCWCTANLPCRSYRSYRR